LVVVLSVAVTTCRIDQLFKAPADAILHVTPSLPDSLIDSAATGSTAHRLGPLAIVNQGGGELDWDATAIGKSSWLAFQPESGKAGNPMMVVFKPDTLPPGIYHDTVVIRTPSAISKTPVRFTVYPCHVVGINYGDSPSDVLNSADCGSPHRSNGQYAQFYSFSGTALDSASVILTPQQFNGYVALDTAPLTPGVAPLTTKTDCQGNTTLQCIYYYVLPPTSTHTYYVEVSSATKGDSGTYQLQLIHVGRQPNDPDSLDQRQLDSTASIPSGGTVGTSLLLRAVISDPDLVDVLHLEAEVRPVAQIFNNSPNTNPGQEVANGDPAWVMVSGLSDTFSYHWQVRAVDQTGRASTWKPFPGTFTVQTGHNPDPPNTGQYQSDGVTPIPSGGTLNGTTIVWKSTVTDQDGGTVQLRVEAQQVNTPFTNNPTAPSTFVPSGQVATANQTTLTDGATYHWQSQTFDAVRQSAWVNGSTFTVSQAPSKLVFTVQPTQTVAGAPIAPAVKVTAEDANNNPITSFTGNVSIQITPGTGTLGAVLSGTVSAAAVAGVATFSNLSINKSGIGYQLQASAVINSNTISTNSTSFNIVAGAATQLKFTVEPSTAQATVPFSPTVTVSAMDANLNVNTSFTGSVAISFVANPGGGVLTGTPVTAAAGVASFPALSINRSANGYILQASSGGLKPDTSVAFTITPGPVTHLAFIVNPGSAQAGATIAPPVQVAGEDANNNIVTSFTGTVTLAIGTNPPGNGILSGAPPTAAVNGVAQFSSLSIDKVGNGYTLTAASGVLTGAVSNPFNISNTQISPTLSTVVPNPTTITASNGASQSTITVTARDLSNNTVAGASVSLSVTGLGNTVLPAGSQLTNGAGVATWTLSSTAAEVKTVTAFINSVQITTQPTVTVNPGPVSSVPFTVQPSQTTAGVAISPAVQVTAKDAFGNIVNTFNGSVSVSIVAGPGGVFTPASTTMVTAAAGVANFSNLHIQKAGAVYQLQASGAALTSLSNTFSVVVAAPFQLTFTTQPATTAIGAKIDSAISGVVVTVQDSVGNTTPSFAGTVRIIPGVNPSGATLSGGSPISTVNGAATFQNLTLNKLGSGYTLVTTSAGPSLASDESTPFDIIPGPAKSLVFKTQPTTTVAGSTITPPVQVTALDAFGDTAIGFSGNVLMAIGTNPSSGTLSGTVTVAAVAGTATATFSSLSIDKAGAGYTLVASTPNLPSGPVTSGTSAGFTVQPGGVSIINSTIVPSTPTMTACKNPGCSPNTTAATITVTAKDAGGNPVPGQTVVLSTSGNGDNITQPAAVTDAFGVASGTITDTTVEILTVRATIGGTLINAAPTVSVSPSSPAVLLFIGQPRDTTAGAALKAPAGIQVRIQDQFHNNIPGATNLVGISILVPPSPAGATLSGVPNPKAAVNGIATFTNLSIDKAGTGYELLATGLTTNDTSSVFNITAGGATQLQITTQPSANAQSGIAIPQQPAIQLLDALNNPVNQSGVVITATINTGPGGGSVGGTTTAMTSGTGLATFSTLNISGPVGNYTLHFATGGLSVNSNSIALSAGAANKLSITTQPSSSPQSGVAFGQQPVIQVLDAANNPVSQSLISVTATINTGGGAIGGTTSASTNGSGVATFTNLSIAGTIGNRTLHFAATSLTAVNSATINLTAGPMSKLVFTTQPSTTTAGQTIGGGSGVVVTAEDAQNNVVTTFGGSVSIAPTAATGTSGATLSGTTSMAASSGVAQFSNLSIDSAGTNYKLDATSGAFSVTSTAFNINAGAVAQLVFTGQPSDATANTNISPAIVVTAKDAIGNTVTSFTGNVDMVIAVDGALLPPATLGGTTTKAAVGGVATFSDLQIDQPGSGYKLQASSGATTSPLSAAFNIL
jgi:hypothetical protein